MELDAPLYRALAQHGVGPEQIDAWEPWQAAEYLEGLLDRAHAMEHSGSRHRTFRPRTARVTGVAPVRSGRDLLAERVAAAREGRPPPQAEEDSGRRVAAFAARLSGVEGVQIIESDADAE